MKSLVKMRWPGELENPVASMFRQVGGTRSGFCDPMGGCHLSRWVGVTCFAFWVGVTCFAFVFFGAFVVKSLPRPANDRTSVGVTFLWCDPLGGCHLSLTFLLGSTVFLSLIFLS